MQQLVDFTQAEVDKAGEPAFLVGHSLGGFLSLMAAARQPALARGVVLLDSPVLGGWRATTLGLIKSTQIVAAVSPGAVSQRRRNSWPEPGGGAGAFPAARRRLRAGTRTCCTTTCATARTTRMGSAC